MSARLIGVAGLIGVYVERPRGVGVYAVGLDLTPALSWALVAVGAAAGSAMLHRRVAKVFTAAMAIVSLPMVITSAVAATHHTPGPFGFTAGATVLYAAVFCANLGTGIWLIPNHVEGPTWMHTGR